MDCDSDAVVLLDHDVPAVRLQAHHGGIGWVRGELGCLLGKHRDDTSVLIRQGSSAAQVEPLRVGAQDSHHGRALHGVLQVLLQRPLHLAAPLRFRPPRHLQAVAPLTETAAPQGQKAS